MYKHLDGDYTGEIIIKVKADANAHLVMNNIASHCRIPDHQFVSDPNTFAGPDAKGGPQEKELHFMLTWQRVDGEISTLRRRFFQAITEVPLVRDAFVELVKFDLLTVDQVKMRRAEKAPKAPRIQLAEQDAA